MPRVSIIIVAYNNAAELPLCLDSIYTQGFRGWELLVVDNCSQDGSREFLLEEQRKKGFKLIRNDKNVGFCRAHNQAIKDSCGEFILFLNPDAVLLEKDALATFVRAMDKEENLASVTGKLLKDPIKKIIDSAGMAFKKYGYITFDRGQGEFDCGQYDKDEYVFGPSCACALYRRKALEDAKYNGQYFDEDFFAYFEDADLAWRVRNNGWLSKYIHGAAIKHPRKGAHALGFTLKALAYRNAYVSYLKNACWEDIVNPLKLAYNIASIIKHIIIRPYALAGLAGVIKSGLKIIRYRRNRPEKNAFYTIKSLRE